ncbi:HAD family hydrolase [Leucobacter salsicius]|uniref:HAD family hydrolase n=1 Tax=Leucobacter salsicius TaxID=664638 RepID=UPI000A03C3CC|nr:HAD family hydrolase [Leucobacter salsicius]
MKFSEVVILFDWNGTVARDVDRAHAALNLALTSRGLPALDAQQFGEEFRLPMETMFTRLRVADWKQAEAEWNSFMEHNRTSPRAGLPALQQLHREGARMGVVSAASEKSVCNDIAEFGIGEVLTSVAAPVADKVASLRQLRGDEAVAIYVGDTAYDMCCAVEAGYIPVAVSSGYSPVEVLVASGANVVIDSFDEFPGVVASLVQAAVS